jgi:hypothetical protein
MGKIFSTEELVFGEFPEIGAHRLAAEHIMDGMYQIGEDMGTESLSYMIHGSVGVGKENRRSDIDFIAIYPDQLALKTMQKITPFLRSMSKQYQIPIEYNIVSDKEAEEGSHRVLPMFRDYLKGAQEESQYVVGKPADAIEIPSGKEFEPDMIKYLVYKRDMFGQAFTNYSGSIDWHQFGRALELPKSLGKKYRQLGEKALTRLYVASEESDLLRSVDGRVTEITEEVLELGSRKMVEEYDSYMRTNYHDVMGLAARLSFKHSLEYRNALKDW